MAGPAGGTAATRLALSHGPIRSGGRATQQSTDGNLAGHDQRRGSCQRRVHEAGALDPELQRSRARG
jgi:hypothetical protein